MLQTTLLGAGNSKFIKPCLTALMLLCVVFEFKLFWNWKTDIASGYGDFIIFYTGAEILKAGLGTSLYDYETQKLFQDKFAVPFRAGPLPFSHPPFELLVFLPLSYFPYWVAYITWTVVNLILLIASFRLLVPLLADQNKTILGIALIGFYPCFIAIAQGQDSILLTFLIIATFNRLKYRDERTAGTLLALGLFKPQLVLPLACVFLWKRQWVFLSAFLGVLICVVGISLAMVGWKGAWQYLSFITEINRRHYTIYPENMPNIRGFAETLFNGESLIVVSGISVILFAWLFWIWRGEIRPAERLFDLKYSFAVVISLLSSYHLYVHDLTILALPVILTLDRLFTEVSRFTISTVAAVSTVVLLSNPVPYRVLAEHGLLPWVVWLLLVLASGLTREILCAGPSTTMNVSVDANKGRGFCRTVSQHDRQCGPKSR